MQGKGKDWQKCYEQGETPWDLGAPTAPLLNLLRAGFLDRLELPSPAQVAVPGCGRGHDLEPLAKAGLTVTGLDLSQGAVQAARDQLSGQEGIQVLCRDVLGLLPEFSSSFHLVYDYTCFCALPPHLRASYAQVLSGILQADGWYLSLAFPTQQEVVDRLGPDPNQPPFLMQEADLQAAFAQDFLLVDSFAAEGSPEERGAERWFLYRKRR